MSEEHGADVTSDVTVESAESNEAEASNGRRGRPRDPSVVERDQRVLGALSDGEPKTKAQLASELGLEPNVVYLSLWRLHREGAVSREQRAWRQVTTV